MATTYKVLGQSAPTATTDTDVYTVPAATTAVLGQAADSYSQLRSQLPE